jgi:UDP-glucose:(heptosyl)LPS alpha-1,3-glucosyltransferase
MRIAYVVHDYHRAGGHSRYVAELATRFSREHEVHVFANRIERGESTAIRFHKIPAWRANALTTVLSFALPATFQIGRGFDIIHTQGFCCFRGNIFTSHICNRAWHLALKELEGGVTWRESIFNAVATSLEHGLYRFTGDATVIAISQRVADDIMRFYHCRAPVQVIHHGVDLCLFSPQNRQRWRAAARARHTISGDEMVYLYVGDLRKGARRCILALARLATGRLLFVSRSEDAPYRRLAEESGLGDRVIFPGATSQVERAYAAADALLLPTPYDAFAMVVTEAMACGLPVVVSREAGACELITDQVNGLVLNDATSVEELAGHMRFLESDPGRAASLGAAARSSVETLSWDEIAGRTMCVYEDVLRGSRGARGSVQGRTTIG